MCISQILPIRRPGISYLNSRHPQLHWDWKGGLTQGFWEVRGRPIEFTWYQNTLSRSLVYYLLTQLEKKRGLVSLQQGFHNPATERSQQNRCSGFWAQHVSVSLSLLSYPQDWLSFSFPELSNSPAALQAAKYWCTDLLSVILFSYSPVSVTHTFECYVIWNRTQAFPQGKSSSFVDRVLLGG